MIEMSLDLIISLFQTFVNFLSSITITIFDRTFSLYSFIISSIITLCVVSIAVVTLRMAGSRFRR